MRVGGKSTSPPEGMRDISAGEVVAMSDGLALICLIAFAALCG